MTPYQLLALSIIHQALADIKRPVSSITSEKDKIEAEEFLQSGWCRQLCEGLELDYDWLLSLKDKPIKKKKHVRSI